MRQLEKRLWKLVSEYVRRMRADDNGYVSCFTCGRVKHWKEMDAGHYVGRQHKGVKFEIDNLRPQCKRCNGFEEGRKEVFRDKLVEELGENRVLVIEHYRHNPHKLQRFDLEVKVEEMKAALKELDG